LSHPRGPPARYYLIYNFCKCLDTCYCFCAVLMPSLLVNCFRNNFEGTLESLSQFETREAQSLMTEALEAMDTMNNAIILQNEVCNQHVRCLYIQDLVLIIRPMQHRPCSCDLCVLHIPGSPPPLVAEAACQRKQMTCKRYMYMQTAATLFAFASACDDLFCRSCTCANAASPWLDSSPQSATNASGFTCGWCCIPI